MSDDPASAQVETPDGNDTVKETVVYPTPQQITTVSGDELKRLQSLGEEGPRFVATYLPDIRNPDLHDYDRAFRAWQLSDSKQHTKEQVIETLGGYLGNKCIADFDMEWVTVADEYGTDYAIHGAEVEVLAFPFSTVMKRIEDNEYDFLYGVYHAVRHTLESDDMKQRDAE